MVLVLIVLGVAAYIGYPYIKGMLHKSDADSPSAGQAATNGGSAPLQEVNAVMDAADPSSASTPAPPPANNGKAARQPAPAPGKTKR